MRNDKVHVMKVMINGCFGGFGFSDTFVKEYTQRKGLDIWVIGGVNELLGPTYSLVPPEERIDKGESSIGVKGWHEMSLEERQAWNAKYSEQTFSPSDIKRDDELAIQIVEELGAKECSARFANIDVVEIPDDVKWHIEEYDGSEWIAEDHRTWGR